MGRESGTNDAHEHQQKPAAERDDDDARELPRVGGGTCYARVGVRPLGDAAECGEAAAETASGEHGWDLRFGWESCKRLKRVIRMSSQY